MGRVGKLSARVDQVVETLRASSTDPTITNATDLLSIDSHKILELCNTYSIDISFQEVESLKNEVSAAILASDTTFQWSDLSDPFSYSSAEISKCIHFGNPELDVFLQSLSRSALIELFDTTLASAGTDPFQPGHHVVIQMTIASAAKGSRVLLIDSGHGTEIGK